jgi:transposase
VLFVAWDWASQSHDVTVLDEGAAVVDRFSLVHDEAGLRAGLDRLGAVARPQELPVAIETTSGLVVDRLLAAGHSVVPIHPNAFHATRPRWGAARAKSDPGDSLKLADYLRTEGHRLRRLRPIDPASAELQDLVRMRDDHVEAKVGATNQLRSLLERHWPGAVGVFARLDSEIALAFLEDYPTPQAAGRLGETRMQMFCKRHSYCDRRGPSELLQRLRAAPAVHFRWAANTRVRDALQIFADNSRHASPWAARLYTEARSRGKRHPHGSCPVKWLRFVTAILAPHAIAASSSVGSSPPWSSSTLAIEPMLK